MLTVRHGPFQPSLEEAFAADLRARRAENPLSPLAVVAPSRAMSDRLQRLACAEGGLSLLGVRFHTFRSLAEEVLGAAGSRLVPADALVVERLLDSLLARGPRRRRLAGAYRASLKDLLDAGAGPQVRDLVSEGLAGGGLPAARLQELLGLLAQLEESLARLGLAAPSALVRAATAAAPSSPALGRYSAFLYYGFYDLTGLQADFLEAVAGSHETTLYYPYRKGRAAFAFADRFFQSRLHQGGRAPSSLPEDFSRRALGPALDALFEPGRCASLEPGALRIFNASGERDEVWRAAKEVLRLVEREGYRYDEVGIVARTLEPYRGALEEALRESCVPFHFATGGALLRRPAARACLTLLALARREFPSLAVLDLVDSPFFRRERDPRWRALVRRLRIGRGWLQWEGKLASASGEEEASLWRLVSDWRRDLTPAGLRRWSAWSAHARALLEKHLRAAEDPAFGAVFEVLDGLSRLDCLGAEVPWPEFLAAAEEALARAELPAAPGAAGVRVLDAMQARGESFRALFLLGLCEGSFPRTIREDPILRDEARLALRDSGGYWLSPKAAGHEEEKLLFWLTAASASERLYVSYPRSEEDGRARIPSNYLLDLFRAASLGTFGEEAGAVERVSRQPLERLGAPALDPFLSAQEAAAAAALRGEASPAARQRAALLNRPGDPGSHDGIVGPLGSVAALLRAGLSPSALAGLFQCPFAFFASRLLGLEEPEEPSDGGEISAAVKGEIYHEILAAFYAALEGAGYWAAPGPFPEEVFKGASETVFARRGWRALGLYPLLWEILRERMDGHLRRFLARDLAELARSGMRPRALESPLAGTLAEPLPAPLSGLLFHGRADRVDAGGGTFRVVDYKSRWKKGGLEKLALAGKSWQPPIYLELSGRDPSLSGLAPAGARFCPIEGDKDHEYPAAFHAESRGVLLSTLASMVESVRRGEFPIRPDESEGGHCGFCPLPGACRKAHPASLARARAGARR